MHLEYVTYNLLFVKKVFSEIDFHYLNEKKITIASGVIQILSIIVSLENAKIDRKASWSFAWRWKVYPASKPVSRERTGYLLHPEVRSKYPSRAMQFRRSLPVPVCFDLRESSTRCTNDALAYITG